MCTSVRACVRACVHARARVREFVCVGGGGEGVRACAQGATELQVKIETRSTKVHGHRVNVQLMLTDRR